MDYKEFWNYIVKQHEKNYNALEGVVQAEWENFFSEIFGYKKLFGEIDTHRNIHIGCGQRTIPDIIIKEEHDLFDVELKQYNLPFIYDYENQLKSYMDLLHINVGLLICQKLYVYVYNRNKFKKLEIPFEENNMDGIKLLELLSKGNFSEEKIESFIDGKNSALKHIQEIKEQIDRELLFGLLKDYFYGGEYQCEEIEKALEDFDIIIRDKRLQSNPIAQKAAVKTPSQPTITVPAFDPNCFIEKEDTPDFIIIKTTPKRLMEVNNDLYFAVRHCWRVKLETVQKYKYVLGVVEGTVKAVYEVEYWQLVNDGSGRYEFIGHLAQQEIANLFLGKKIPARFRKQGLASPVLYSRMGN